MASSISLFLLVQYNFCNRDFVTDHQFSTGLRSGEFPDHCNRFKFCFLEIIFTLLDEKSWVKILLEFSSTISKRPSYTWNDFSFNYVNVFVITPSTGISEPTVLQTRRDKNSPEFLILVELYCLIETDRT